MSLETAPKNAPRLTAIVPAYDEERSVEPLHQELLDVARACSLELEIIWVDDGSSDDTWAAFERIVAKDPRSRAIRLRRNFGKTAALAAGLEDARADVIITLDADGQDVPAELPRLLAALEEGADLVNGYKQPRQDPITKVLPSRVFNFLVGLVTGLWLKDHNSGLKAIRSEVFDEVKLYGNLHRFLPVLAHARGFVVKEVPVAHRPRRHGRSKYGAWRFVIGLLDLFLIRLLTDVRGGPQKVLGVVGLAAAALGALTLTYLGALWFLQFRDPAGYTPLTDRPLTLYALGALLVGVQVTTLGVLAGLLPIARGTPAEPGYSVRQRAGAARSEEDDGASHGLRLARGGRGPAGGQGA